VDGSPIGESEEARGEGGERCGGTWRWAANGD